MTVKLIWTTPDTEAVIAHCARVSNPKNQDNPDYEGLLKYCIRNNHISIFEMASACLEIQCSRTIARQILRHRSFSFQEFSGRYAEMPEEPIYTEARRQDPKNRQNSVDDMSDEVKHHWHMNQLGAWTVAWNNYQEALSLGVAKEVARSILPEGMVQTTMYMTGTIRSWINFLDVRWQGPGVQLECRNVAEDIATILQPIIPTIFKAKGWEV
jgi:thymidylate synthase (FAD)